MMEIHGIVPMTEEGFFDIPSGTHIYNYGNDQCVALANLYTGGVLDQPIPPGIQSAYQWWTTYSEKPDLYNYFTQVSNDPKRGDIFVSKGGVYDSVHGHIGVVQHDWNGKTFGTMENGYWNGISSMERFNRNMSNVLGFLRPKNTPQPPTPTIAEDDEMKLLFWNSTVFFIGKQFMSVSPDGRFTEMMKRLYGDSFTVDNADFDRLARAHGIPDNVRDTLYNNNIANIGHAWSIERGFFSPDKVN